MYHIVYQTTNLVNLKIYIGIHSTNNLDDGYIGSGKTMIKAIKKYGKENFKKEILHYCKSREEACDVELYLVNEQFVERPDVYNIRLGGGNKGVMSKESKIKLSNSLKKTYSNNNYINKHIGRKRSEETKEKMLIKNKRSFKEKYGERYLEMIDKCCRKFKEENGFYGKNHTEKTKKILSEIRSKNYIIKSPLNEVINFKGILRDFCNNNDLSFSCLYRNINKGIIQETSYTKRSQLTTNCVGWEIKSN
jgi:hypothetical protein